VVGVARSSTGPPSAVRQDVTGTKRRDRGLMPDGRFRDEADNICSF